MASGLVAPPGGELCVFLLRDEEEEEEEEEEERRREVGCQWESPESPEERRGGEERREERREVGCQSEAAERRDAAVQVDLPSQQLSWSPAGSSSLLLQCFGVRPDGPDGGALLQHCTNSTSKPAVRRHPAVLQSSVKRTRRLLPPARQRSCCGLQSGTQRERRRGGPNAPRTSPPAPSTKRTPSLLRTVRLPHIPLYRLPLHAPHQLPVSPSTSCQPTSSPPAEEEEGEEEAASDPTWNPPDGDSDALQSSSILEEDPIHQEDHQEDHQGPETEPPETSICDVCGKVMKCKSSLARHSFIHTGEKPFACHLCELRFNRRDNLQHHLKRLHPGGATRVQKRRSDGRAWLCEVCGKTFNCRSRLKTHEIIHSGVKPHPCDLCPKAYMRTNDLEHHKKIVHVDGTGRPPRPSSLLCDLCGKEFKCRSQLAVHFQTHTGERPHLCDLCGRRFSRPYQLKRHKILVHMTRAKAGDSPPLDSPFVCTVCGRRLKSHALLTAHSRIHTGDKPHRCSICLCSFQRATRLKQHQILVHLKVKPDEAPQTVCRRKDPAMPRVFACQVCSRAFKFKSLLASHSLIHTGVKPHACEFCNRSFRRLSHLKRHREVVHANGSKALESFVCKVCGKDKKCKSNLERHAIIHTGEKPHACDLCAATFNRRGNLQQHVRRMHGVGGWPADGDTPSVLDVAEDDELVSTLVSAVSFKREESLGSVDSGAFDPTASNNTD